MLEPQAIRTLIIRAFDDQELSTFCFDHYREVYEQFTVGMTKIRMVNLLIDYCERRGDLQSLVARIQRERPGLFPGTIPVDFIDREFELQKACGHYPAPYIVFIAPSGYGKTALLRAIEYKHQQDNWWCVYTDAPAEIESARDLAYAIAQQAGCIGLRPSTDITKIGYILAGYICAQIHVRDIPGALVLIDSIERLPESDIEPFFNDFLIVMTSQFERLNIRLCLAGCYHGSWWRNTVRKKEFHSTLLALFPFKEVKNAVFSLSLSHAISEHDEDTLALYAAHMMHITGGHPECVARLIQQVDVKHPAEQVFRQGVCREIVVAVANEIREAVPSHLRHVLDVLCVFRRYNYRLLQQMIQSGLIEYIQGAEKLEEELTATHLVRRESGFIEDQTVRRVLAIRLRLEEPQRFIELCTCARDIYAQDILSPTSRRPEMIAVECIYQDLHLAFYQGTQTASERQELRALFLADDGLIHKYMETLLAKPDAPDMKADFLALLQSRRDWEFQFAVNFFMRGASYTDEPYISLLQRMDEFFADA